MKKKLLMLIFVISAVVANAATYRVKYDVNNERSVNFIVKVEFNQLLWNQQSFSLRRMGTITNSGITFDSYCYGRRDGMFCVATSSMTVKKDFFTTLTGYLIIIDQHAYLADKIN